MYDDYYENRGNQGKRIAKKVCAIVLSAALFGSTAGAAFHVVTNVLEPDTRAEVQTQEQDAVKETAEDTSKEKAVQTVSTTGTAAAAISDVSAVAESVMPSVVAITNKSVQEVQSYFSMFGRGAQVLEQEVESCGSGIIIGQNDTELLIVTNNHVVEGADTLSVCFVDDQAYEAKIKGTDADNDLAVIAVPLGDISSDTMSQIKVAQIGSSDELKVGEQVVAIGNALGYGQSVTTGIVSALNRVIAGNENAPELIQTDAAINPGNSGGALLNMNGEVIGINSSKFASTEVEGMGYAIPVSTASPILEDLMNRETREKVAEDQASYLGISGKDVSAEIEEAYGIPQGIYVASVEEGGAAAQGGITPKSVIVKFDGTRVTNMEELKAQMEYYAAGESVVITLKTPSSDGEYVETEVTVTLGSARIAEASSQMEQKEQQSLFPQNSTTENSFWSRFLH